VLEWYTRVKVKLEDYYNLYHNTVPRNCTILNIGCGYGYMDYMLYLCANDRKITGVDYDAEKVEVANNCWLRNEHVNFVHADITTYDFGNHDVFIINDTLHYIPYQAQEALLVKCFSKLNDGGMILIKDANTKNEKKQRFTWLTEFFSTNFGFNKTAHATLFFPDEEFIAGIARKHGMVITKLEESKVTSNTMYLIKKG
jgi:2-polyprenyl-3-methyl-5-hydroxy-6-metoxy-1,4-benzoquinol methylase